MCNRHGTPQEDDCTRSTTGQHNRSLVQKAAQENGLLGSQAVHNQLKPPDTQHHNMPIEKPRKATEGDGKGHQAHGSACSNSIVA